MLHYKILTLYYTRIVVVELKTYFKYDSDPICPWEYVMVIVRFTMLEYTSS